MKVKIKENATEVYLKRLGFYQPINYKWKAILEHIEGKILDVDTKYMFKGALNVIMPTDGLHLTSSDVNTLHMENIFIKEFIDDIRPFHQRCGWCGKISKIDNNSCPSCNKDEYLENLI